MNISEREETVNALLKQKVHSKKIADQIGMSLRDVYKIKRKKFGENKVELTNEQKAVRLYSTRKTPVEVVLELNLPCEEATQYYLK